MNSNIKKHCYFSIILSILVALVVFSTVGLSQDNEKKYTERQYRGALNMLDPRPFDPAIDPDIDMFINSWTNSMPFNTHGMLVERRIMTRCDGDPLHPPRKGAVLKYVNYLAQVLLDAGCVTKPTALSGEQEIFYFVDGEGEISGGGKTFKVRNGNLALVPAGLEFILRNTGGEPLIMYLINEPIPEGFRPNDSILIKDELSIDYRSQNTYGLAHWIHNGKDIFTINDGLGTLSAVNIGTMNAMTIGQAHSHGEGIEEVWVIVRGRNLEQLGREIRWIEPGMAFMVPPTGFTPHSHINTTQEPVKFLLFARWGDSPRRP